jgi:hypothetical protein
MCGRGHITELCNLRLSGEDVSLESKGRYFLHINPVRAVKRDLLNIPCLLSDVLFSRG